MSNTQPEPSMDDILASIRRIISEDDQATSPEAGPAAEADEKHVPAAVKAKMRLQAQAPIPAPVPAVDTSTVEDGFFAQDAGAQNAGAQDEGMNRGADAPAPIAALASSQVPAQKLPAQEAPLQALPVGSPDASPPVGAEVFGEITPEALAHSPAQPQPAEAIFEAEPEPTPTSAQISPVPTPAPQAVSSQPREIPVPSYAAGGSQPRRVVVPEDSLLAASPSQALAADSFAGHYPVQETEGLLASASAGAAVNAFETLSENMRIATGEGGTLEDVVERLLEPMLKNWLDMNLPRIVEDKVEDEVRRIARRR